MGYNNRIILTLGLFFGWLLAIPFNGPVLHSLILAHAYQGPSLSLAFSIANATGFLFLAFVRETELAWLKLMFLGLGGALLPSILLFFLPTTVWPFLFVLMGVSSSLFIIGWSVPYSSLLDKNNRIKYMASIIALSNIILLVATILLNFISSSVVYYLLLTIFIPLFLILGNNSDTATFEFNRVITEATFPRDVILILTALIFGLYINGGFLYGVIYPSLLPFAGIDSYYRLLPYLIPLFIMYRYGKYLSSTFSIYMSSSLMGLAFVSFSLLHNSLSGYFITITLIQGGFALLDLFVFTILGDLARNYGHGNKIFGYCLAANVGAIICGELMGERIAILSTSTRNVTSLFAAAIIFLTILIIPWFSSKNPFLTKESDTKEPQAPPVNLLLTQSLDLSILTPRELEVASLLIQGYSNSDIAKLLFISTSTLKTHIHNIYQKLGITHKRELISRAINKNT